MSLIQKNKDSFSTILHNIRSYFTGNISFKFIKADRFHACTYLVLSQSIKFQGKLHVYFGSSCEIRRNKGKNGTPKGIESGDLIGGEEVGVGEEVVEADGLVVAAVLEELVEELEGSARARRQ